MIIDKIQALTGPTKARITIDTEVKMNKKDVETKKIANPYMGARKIVEMIVTLAPQYEAAVNEARESEGKETDFEAGARKWGDNLGNGIVQKGDKLYVSFIAESVESTSYFMDGTEISKDLLKPYMPIKKVDPTKGQGVENVVQFRTVSLENIAFLEVI